jgi:hypothetical protein
MIGAQHRPEVKQLRQAAPAGVDKGTVLTGAQAESARIGRSQPCIEQAPP